MHGLSDVNSVAQQDMEVDPPCFAFTVVQTTPMMPSSVVVVVGDNLQMTARILL